MGWYDKKSAISPNKYIDILIAPRVKKSFTATLSHKELVKLSMIAKYHKSTPNDIIEWLIHYGLETWFGEE